MSRRHHQGNNNNKRRSGWDDDDEVVDDLAHAATFAMMTMPTTTSTTETSPLEILPGGAAVNTNTNTNEKVVLPIDDSAMIEDAENDGDIELEESSTEGESESGDDDSNKKEEDDDDDDDDDDQSDEDLAEALARMDPDETLEEEDDDEQPSNKMSRPPKTENELDSYRTPIQELEKHLQFQLSVTPEEAGTTTAAGANTSRSLTASNLQLAGRIKHFMAFDRTIVVESSASNPHGDATSFLHEKAPLDEGTLLVLRVPPEQDESKAGNSLDDEQLIPLGRIFEVFGPVSQPLYTIRLPSKIPVASKKEQSKPAKSASAAQEKGTSMVDSTSVPPEAPSDKLDDKKSDGNNDSEQVAAAEGEPIGDAATQVVAQEEKQVTTSDTIASTPVERAPPDPWAPTGKYAKLLQKNNAVYYVRDEAKLIDTGFIMKMSRKGCDASNIYDEEVQQSNEMYYSDDEEEREAKNRRKKSKGSNQGQRGTLETSNTNARMTNNARSPSLPTGFHHGTSNTQRSVPPPPPAAAATSTLPGGFHQPPQAYPRPYGGQPVPPAYRQQQFGMPPAPNRSFPHPPPAPNAPNGAPPPPPPPGSSAPPPAYQY